MGADPAERRRAPVALSALLLTMLLGQPDMNVVATALPSIVGDIGDTSYLAWVTTAYVLAVSVTTPAPLRQARGPVARDAAHN